MKLELKIFGLLLCCLVLWTNYLPAQTSSKIQLPSEGRVVLLGDGLVERMNEYGYFETLLQSHFHNNNLLIRNCGWSGDDLEYQLRLENHGNISQQLLELQPDVVLAFLGGNDSFKGAKGLQEFKTRLENFVQAIEKLHTRNHQKPQLILFSPIAMEPLKRLKIEVHSQNKWRAEYTRAMKEFAQSKGLAFVDLFAPSLQLFKQSQQELTINGLHLSAEGYQLLSEILSAALDLGIAKLNWTEIENLRKTIVKKNKEFFYLWRPVNAEYIVGARKEPFGVKTFPPEMRQIAALVKQYDQKIWTLK